LLFYSLARKAFKKRPKSSFWLDSKKVRINENWLWRADFEPFFTKNVKKAKKENLILGVFRAKTFSKEFNFVID